MENALHPDAQLLLAFAHLRALMIPRYKYKKY
jgi:hypothetical protein